VIKLINWLTKIIIQTILIAGLTVYLTWVTVHTYVDKLLSKYHMDTAESKIQFSDFLSQISASLNILKPSNLNNQAVVVKPDLTQSPIPTEIPSQQTLADPLTSEIPLSPTPTPISTPSTTPMTTDGKSTATATTPKDSVSVFKQTTGNESKQQGNQKDLVMSAEQFTKKKDQLSEADKVKIFTMLATRLPQAEFQKISTYVEDGVTQQELSEIQSIVEKYVKPEEYKQLQDLLSHY
jgi:hypothetical protein